MRRRPDSRNGNILADEVLRFVDIIARDQNPRRAVAKIEDNDHRQAGNGRRNPGGDGREKIDVAVDQRLRLDGRAHLDVFGFQIVFLQESFFLCHVEGHVRKRQGGKTDANFLQAFGRLANSLQHR